MSKQYHYVVTYNVDTRKFSIDFEQTYTCYMTGNRWNSTLNEWETPDETDERYVIEELNNKLKKPERKAISYA